MSDIHKGESYATVSMTVTLKAGARNSRGDMVQRSIQWYKALWKHEMTRSLAREAERDEYKALLALREAEVAAE